MNPAYLIRLQLHSPLHAFLLPPPRAVPITFPAAANDTNTNTNNGRELTARERRQLRQERRESKAYDWRDKVEERLSRRTKKPVRLPLREQRNLDRLADLGPRWWIVLVSRAPGAGDANEVAGSIARGLERNFPDLQFKVCYPCVHHKKKKKDGTYSVKSKPLFSGRLFLQCTLNREIHDFIRQTNGVAGFVGNKIGLVNSQINKPKPIPDNDMEIIFKQAKEEQENADRAVEGQEQQGNANNSADSGEMEKSKENGRIGIQSRKGKSKTGRSHESLKRGLSVCVLSGPFAEFTGYIEKLDRKNDKAIVRLELFGKETFVDIDIDQIETINT